MRRLRGFVTIAVLVVLGVAGCQRGPKTPEEAFLGLERAVAAGDSLAFYKLLDEKTRWSVESVVHDQKLMRTIISAKYPEAEAQKALQPLAAADEGDAAHFFARLDSTRHIAVAYRKRLGSLSGPVMKKPEDADNVWVARQDGMPFHFHHDKHGWFFSELEQDWALEKDRTIHALHTVQENAKLYQKADNQ